MSYSIEPKHPLLLKVVSNVLSVVDKDNKYSSTAEALIDGISVV